MLNGKVQIFKNNFCFNLKRAVEVSKNRLDVDIVLLSHVLDVVLYLLLQRRDRFDSNMPICYVDVERGNCHDYCTEYDRDFQQAVDYLFSKGGFIRNSSVLDVLPSLSDIVRQNFVSELKSVARCIFPPVPFHLHRTIRHSSIYKYIFFETSLIVLACY